jgi:hypothetical protein
MPQIKVLLLLLVACACSARAQDAMSLPGNCSGEPPAWSGPAARVPEVETPRRGSATLLGTVSDAALIGHSGVAQSGHGVRGLQRIRNHGKQLSTASVGSLSEISRPIRIKSRRGWSVIGTVNAEFDLRWVEWIP